MSCRAMDDLLLALRAAAEPTRLRLLALAARGAFCVVELTEILGQSQPRLSRHLKLLCDAGLLERVREGANVWLGLPSEGAGAGRAALVRDLVARVPADDPVLAADRRGAARVLAERARTASDSFRRQGADWDEMGALDLPAAEVEAALLQALPARIGRALDIGTGTGRLLELLAPRVDAGLGVDASRNMVALARARLSRTDLAHCAVRLGDMYRLPLPDGRYDAVVLQMVLHYAEDPGAAVAEAARVLAPGGTLVVIDLLRHDRTDLSARLAHRWPGFDDAAIAAMLDAAGLPAPHPAPVTVTAPGPGKLPIRLWLATNDVAVATPARLLEPVSA